MYRSLEIPPTDVGTAGRYPRRSGTALLVLALVALATACTAGTTRAPAPSSSASAVASRTGAVLIAEFPLPAGVHESHEPPVTSSSLDRAWDVTATVAGLKAFYDSRLPMLGIRWVDPKATTDDRTGAVAGWTGDLVAAGSPPINGSLQLLRSSVDRSVVRIEVQFHP